MEPLFKNNIQWNGFYKQLNDWIGTPYKHFKMEKGIGADCCLFIAYCLEKVGIIKDSEFDRPVRFWHRYLQKEYLLECINDMIDNKVDNKRYVIKKVNDSKIIRGDILIFNLLSKLSNHMAIYLNNDFVINAYGKEVCIMEYDNKFKNRLTNKFRIYKIWQKV